eukprot:gene9528-12088_t
MAATESQTAKGPPLAGKASAMDLPLRSNIMFMAERRRGLPRKTDTPTAAIDRVIKEHNQEPRPFVWKAGPEEIMAAVKRGHQVLASDH